MKIAVVIPTWNWTRAGALAATVQHPDVEFHVVGPDTQDVDHVEYLGAIETMHLGVAKLSRPPADYDWILFLHDDVVFHAPVWYILDLLFLVHPAVGLIGFGGARGLGHPDLYKYPMNDITRLARSGYVSNTTDAEVHGERSTVPVHNLATLDGFCLGLRGSLYDQCSWSRCLGDGFLFHGYDHWLALCVRELGYTVSMLPVSCTHKGGGTEVQFGEIYRQWCKEHGHTPESLHIDSHRLLYNRFRNVLPVETNAAE